MQAIALLVFLAADTDDVAAKKEIALLEGKWKVTVMESKGKRHTEKDIPIDGVVFGGKGFDIAKARKEGAKVSHYKLGVSNSPKTIEVTPIVEKKEGLVGIYALDGDTLKLCFLPAGKAPPAGFKTGPDTEAVYLELKREKR